MSKKPNAKTIIEQLKRPKRNPVLATYRIDKKIKEDFSRVCEHNKVSAALALEKLMQGFVEEAHNEDK